MNPFFNYYVLFSQIKKFEPRKNGWIQSHRPHEPYEFPPKKYEDVSPDHVCDAQVAQEHFPKLYSITSKRNSMLTEKFQNQWDIEEVKALLYSSLGSRGEERQLNSYYKNHNISLKRYPSAGAMYGVDVYVYLSDVEGSENGFYRFYEDSLYKVGNCISLDRLQDMFAVPINNNVKIFVFFVSDLEYLFPKYGYFSYQLSLLEAGHMAENIQLGVAEINKCILPVGGFYSDMIMKELDFLQDNYKHCIYTMLIG